MFEKLKALEDKFNEINEKLMQPETVNNTSLYTSLHCSQALFIECIQCMPLQRAGP